MRLLKLRLKNFRQYGNIVTTINLEGNGITSIKGINGSGKSTIIYAIIFALYGTISKSSAENSKAKNVVKEDLTNNFGSKLNKDAWVEVTLKSDGNTYTIKRHTNSPVISVSVNGIPLDGIKVKDANSIIRNDIIGVSLDEFVSLFCLSFDTRTSFLSPLKDHVENIFNKEKFDKVEKVITENIDKQNKDVIRIETGIIAKNSQIKLIKEQISQREDINAINERNAKLEELKNNKSNTEAELHKTINDISKLEKLEDSIVSKSESIRSKDKDNFAKTKMIEQMIIADENTLNLMSNDVCPTCGQPIEKDHNYINDLVEIIRKKKEALSKIRTNSTIIDSGISKCEQNRRLVKESISSLKNTERQLRTTLSEISGEISSLETSNGSVSGIFDDTIKSLEENILKDSITKEEISTLKKNNDLVYVSLFSRNGIKDQIFHSTHKNFIGLVNGILDDSNISHRLSITDDNEYIIRNFNGLEVSYNTLSTGEQKMLYIVSTVAYILTLSTKSEKDGKICPKFILMDEIMTNIDASNTNMIYELITKLNIERNIEFIIINHTKTLTADEGKWVMIDVGIDENGFSVLTSPSMYSANKNEVILN